MSKRRWSSSIATCRISLSLRPSPRVLLLHSTPLSLLSPIYSDKVTREASKGLSPFFGKLRQDTSGRNDSRGEKIGHIISIFYLNTLTLGNAYEEPLQVFPGTHFHQSEIHFWESFARYLLSELRFIFYNFSCFQLHYLPMVY